MMKSLFILVRICIVFTFFKVMKPDSSFVVYQSTVDICTLWKVYNILYKSVSIIVFIFTL